MPEIQMTRRAARDATAHLNRLGHHEMLDIADRKVCLMAAEWLAQFHEVQSQLEQVEAYLNEEVRRHETTLASLSHRTVGVHEPRHGTQLLDHLRRLKREFESALPASPRSRPFGVGST